MRLGAIGSVLAGAALLAGACDGGDGAAADGSPEGTADSAPERTTVVFEGVTYTLGDAVIISDVIGVRILTIMNVQDTCAAMMDDADAVLFPGEERILVIQDWDVPRDTIVTQPAVDARLYDPAVTWEPLLTYAAGTNGQDFIRFTTLDPVREQVDMRLTFELVLVNDMLMALEPPTLLEATFVTAPCPPLP